MPQKIKIAVVDDHYLFRQGLIGLLKEHDDLKIVFEASNGQELLSHLKKAQPHLILLDIQMPEIGGMQALVEVKKLYPQIKVIALTMHNDDALIFDLMKKGANGFLSKDKSVEEVVNAIYSVNEKGFYSSEELTRAMLRGVTHNQKVKAALSASSLTERELGILQLICAQYSIKEIAQQLTLSVRTIETHKENILMKTGSKNIAGIVLYAIEHHLLK